jgi:hypothetical protein
VTSIHAFLEREAKDAKAILNKAFGTALDQAAVRNEKRKRRRAIAGKKTRERKKSTDGGRVAIPERADLYQALARFLICKRLLKYGHLLEYGLLDQAFEKVSHAKIKIGSARQKAKFDTYFQDRLAQLRASISRLTSEPSPQEGVSWDEERIRVILDMRIQVLQRGFAVLEFQQLKDPIAATICLRECARCAVARRFNGSNHLRSLDRLKEVASIIKLEVPVDLIKSYGELGKEVWSDAVDEFKNEMIADSRSTR